MRTTRTARILFTRLLLLAIPVVIVAVVGAQKSGTESTYRYDESGSLVRTDTTYKDGHVIEKKEFDKAGKLRKRTTYTYLKGFKDPNTSTTEYAPDGETPTSTTNVDHDKNGNVTSTVTTNYDGAGKETGGSKRERDAAGKLHCYTWNAAKQVYEEIECPKVYVSGVGDDSVPTEDKNARVETSAGLQTVIFNTPAAIVRVNLPDDIRAGDTISGTVIAEPKGNTKAERDSNQAELKKLGIRLISTLENKPEDVALGDTSVIFKYSLISDRNSGTVLSVGLLVNFKTIIGQATIPVLPSGAVVTPDPKITVPTTPSGAVITPNPKITVPTTKSGAVITPDPKVTEPRQPNTIPDTVDLDPKAAGSPILTESPALDERKITTSDPKSTPTFIFPQLGQNGRPMVITGPFDGNASNTTLDWTRVRSLVTDFEKNTENVSGGFGLIAESPRKAVFTAPTNVTGPLELTLTEAGKETKGTYRNVGVNLSAPKTDLRKGEQTTLRVEVNGLQGLKAPVPLTLTYAGVITMEGGPYQPLVIQPSQVTADGRYTTTRGITGIQAGGWSATATVVTSPFDFCLQDDSAPSRVVLWNTFTGDYMFSCPGCLPSPRATESGGATATAGNAGSQTSLSGTGTMARKGCIITLTHNAPDRRVFARLDPCSNSGTTTVEAPKTNVKFTITDRNTADNTCACGPGCK